jgi:hypothetical protein
MAGTGGRGLNLTQETAVVNRIINFGLYKIREISWLREELFGFWKSGLLIWFVGSYRHPEFLRGGVGRGSYSEAVYNVVSKLWYESYVVSVTVT